MKHQSGVAFGGFGLLYTQINLTFYNYDVMTMQSESHYIVLWRHIYN